jgi:catechol 2,3-dioxygenase-like lactoylglutathione lyase family enzyme
MNIVCTDFDRSLKFYRDVLGGHVVGEGEGTKERKGPGVSKSAATAVGMGFRETEIAEYRACLIRFGRSKLDTVIDLLQWISPASTGKPYGRMNNVGIVRIALEVDDIDKAYNDLKAKGVEFLSPPQRINLFGSPSEEATVKPTPIRFAMFKDPDGIALELVQFI